MMFCVVRVLISSRYVSISSKAVPVLGLPNTSVFRTASLTCTGCWGRGSRGRTGSPTTAVRETMSEYSTSAARPPPAIRFAAAFHRCPTDDETSVLGEVIAACLFIFAEAFTRFAHRRRHFSFTSGVASTSVRQAAFAGLSATNCFLKRAQAIRPSRVASARPNIGMMIC
jgi:hypothetical protein